MENIPDEEAVGAALSMASEVEYKAAGGFKAMYAAKIKKKPQALKVVYLPPLDEQDEEDRVSERAQLLARLNREVEVLGSCTNPNLVKLGDLKPRIVPIGDHEYYVYSEELLSGEDVLAASTKPRPDLPELKLLMLSILGVINDLWPDYVHRDIKPENIIRTEDPERRFVMLDLGIAYKIHGTQLTARGCTLGTRRYMPPELFFPDYKKVIDFRSDLYSAGVSVYEYAAGHHPLVPGPEDPGTTVWRVLNQLPAKLETVRNDLPREFCRIIDRCMRKQPALRFSDLEGLIKQVEGIS